MRTFYAIVIVTAMIIGFVKGILADEKKNHGAASLFLGVRLRCV